MQLAGPAGPVQVNAPYTVTLDVPNNAPDWAQNSAIVNIALTGTAAVTSAKASAPDWACDFSAGSSGTCWNLAALTSPISVTLTVVPTAGASVTVSADARNPAHKPIGSDSLTTKVQAPAPVVTGLAPDHGPLAGGGRAVLTGSHLTGATAVAFGAVAATAFTVDSDTQITATVPAGAAPGKADVTVTTPGGTAAAGAYTYQDPATAGAYVFSQSADPASGSTVKPGSKVAYTVTVAQQGPDPAAGATVTADLAQVLDDAAYAGDAAANSGTAAVKDGKLTWTGDLPVGGRATITYSVTVDGRLHSTVGTPDERRGTCDSTKSCTADHTVPAPNSPTPTPTDDGGQAPGTPTPAPTAPAGPDPRTPAATAPPAASSSALATTGTGALGSAVAAAALLALGALAAALGRRRGRRA
nr:hypothetical protein KitaXyl93_05760 [Kitasatospora sp. Xyl93]